MSGTNNYSVPPDGSDNADDQTSTKFFAAPTRTTSTGFSVVSPEPNLPKPKKTSSRINQGEMMSSETPGQDTRQTTQEMAEQAPAQENQNQAFADDIFIRGRPNDNDYFLEHGSTIESIPSTTSYPCTISTADGTPLFTGKKCFISFLVDRHVSYLRITIAFSDTREGYTDQVTKKVTLRFPAKACTGEAELRKLDSKNYHNADTTLDCYELTLAYDLLELSLENLLVDSPLREVANLAEYVKRGKKVKCHICGHGDEGAVVRNLRALQDAFTRELTTDPLKKWVPSDKNDFLIQHNELIGRQDRPPHYNLDAKYSFFSWEEYMVIMAIADREEFEHSKNAVTPYEENPQPMYVMSMAGGQEPGGQDRIYLGLLDIPSDDRVRLQPGDVMLIIDPDTEDLETALFGRVTTPIPGIPVSFLTIYLHLQWLKVARQFTSGPFQFDDVIPLTDQATRWISRDDITKHEPVQVQLKIQADECAYKHRIAGLAKLNSQLASTNSWSSRGQLKDVLLGNISSRAEKRNIFSVIEDKVPEPRSVMGSLNEEQEMVYNLALQAPAGFVIVHGPPGTGKTFMGMELIKPFVKAGQDKLSVLCCSASNKSIDAFAVCLHAMVCEDGRKGSYVVRVHSYDTELDIAKAPAIAMRTAPDDLRPQLVRDLGDEEADTLKSMALANAIYMSYKAQHKRVLKHVPDDRVTEESLNLSVGRRVLQLIGLVPVAAGDPTLSNGFKELRENYNQFMADVEFDGEKATEFRFQLKAAREHVLANATVICTTPALACDAKVYDPCSPQVKLIVIDEAARSTEPETLPLFAFYSGAVGKVLLGDPRQLPPLALAPIEYAYFQAQLVLSLQDRLMKGGLSSVMLTKQYRMVPDIARPVNNHAYGGKLIDDPSVQWENRDIARGLRAFNKKKFNRERCVVYLNVTNNFSGIAFDKSNTGAKEFGRTRSRYHETFVMVGINLAKELMDEFPGATIGILTSYNAQYRLYLRAKDNLTESDPKYSRLIVDKVDRAQGMQADIGIVDLVVKHGAGFLNQGSRNNVAVSRWRMGLYLIATKKAIDNSGSRSLLKLQTEYLKIGTSFKVQGPVECNFYTPGDVDLMGGAEHEPEEEGGETGGWGDTALVVAGETRSWEDAGVVDGSST